ncbi:MAG: phosphoglycerate mutase (2,3-diphosphoglycerate-independent) [Candidatus Moranbacteria bacterium RBG_19FT_COMBO_42_6]|nr:MAG: phosphoglycerate mutase (2,3-diphosphoglycerate-independent) [Candidatus Moranbacteria bacterium RBG_19FT_COMBO_42_6]
MYKPVVLLVLDGWGIGRGTKGNALAKASLPTIEKFNQFYPHTALQASGISVGLPWEEAGNSEVGHITLGAGKVIYQSLPRITMDIQSGDFFRQKTFIEAIEHTRKNNSALHFMGLVGKGGVHSQVEHLYALLELARDQKVEKLFIHVFTDGRDSAPNSGADSLKELQQKIASYGVGRIASVSGRYFAMDRNNNWDRVEKAYQAIVHGEGKSISDPVEYLRKSYADKIYDEFIKPAVVSEAGAPIGLVKDNDAVIFFNFREDRARQMTKAFALPAFSEFERTLLKNICFVTMVQYEEGLPVLVAFQPISVELPLGKIVSNSNMKQLRIAETEKFAHVTYFFNGGSEEAYPGEDRVIVPSLAVNDFAGAPQMSAGVITDKVIAALKEGKYNFILMNYANADIVGHTGNESATSKAAEAIDECLGRLVPAVLMEGGCLLITADHGNAEELKNNLTGETNTEHSINPVPIWFITNENHKKDAVNSAPEDLKVEGLLSDVAPTVLELLGLEKSKEMTGESLLPILK